MDGHHRVRTNPRLFQHGASVSARRFYCRDLDDIHWSADMEKAWIELFTSSGELR
jgi:hypothetical protein